MRILAIRGRDLASLEGDFEVRLDADPLTTSGVFAITGRTGAGKSTLLDAVCLPLFDATPRLDAKGGALVGDEDDPHRLPANDVRNLVRKGAGSAFAEVDFIGVDGERYRAHWEARRAYGKPDGRFQDQTLTLVRHDTGEHVADGKRAVKDAIVERLGLTFEQARRSLLLAQNEFASFLSAKGDERALLLEQITGTDLYTRLSMEAFERAREARQALELLKARLGDDAPLDEEARAELVAELAQQQATLEAAEAEQKNAEAAVEHVRREAVLTQSVADAGQHLEQAQESVAEHAELRVQLDQVRAAERLRPQHTRLTDAAARATKGSADVELRGDELNRAQDALAEHAPKLEEAQARAADAAQALEDARPSLRRASELDAELAPAREAVRRSERQLRELTDRGLEAADERASIPARVSDAISDRDAAATWLQSHAELEACATDWSRILAALEELRADHGTLDALEVDEARRTGEWLRRVELRDEARVLHAAAARERDAAQSALMSSVAYRDELVGSRDLAAELVAAHERRRALESLDHRLTDWRRQAELVQRTAAELAAQRSELADLVESLDALEAGRAPLEASLAARESAHEKARAKLDLSEHRAELLPGQECPLCGATEHRFAADSDFDSLVAELREDRNQAKQALRDHDVRLAEARTRQQQSERGCEESQRDLEEQHAQLSSLEEEWAGRAAALGLPTSPGEAEPTLALAWARQEGAERGLTLAGAERHDAQGRIDSLRAAAESARDAADASQRRLDACESDVRDAEQALAHLRQRLEEIATSSARRVATLDASLPTGWRAELTSDADALLEDLAAVVQGWAQQTQRRCDADDTLVNLRARAEKLDTALGPLFAQHVDATAQAESDRARLVQRQVERARLFEGRPAGQVEAELVTARDTRAKTAASAKTEHDGLRAGVLEAKTRLESAQKARATAGDEREQARAALDAALEEAGLTAEELDRRLAHGEAWIESTDAKLRAVDQAATDAKARARAFADQLAKHTAAGPDLEREGLDERLAAAREAAAEARDAFIESKAASARDDAARKRAAKLLVELERAEQEAQLWGEMKALIGSSDGKRFRVFAQSLTLDVLLQHANAHLADLYPRYRLRRVPGPELDLQVVDRDLGDAMRGIKSLSGGETFLASLALALGLASLTASRTTVETLFIDEGFGALDPECLELVLEVLDGLQSSGRQVGVISHVEAIAERFVAQVRVEETAPGRSRVRVVPELASGLDKVA